MWLDWVSNQGFLALESDALPTALHFTSQKLIFVQALLLIYDLIQPTVFLRRRKFVTVNCQINGSTKKKKIFFDSILIVFKPSR